MRLAGALTAWVGDADRSEYRSPRCAGWGRKPDGRGRARESYVFPLAGGGCDGGQPALSPVGDRRQHRFERTAACGEPVAHANRWTWVNQSLDQAFGLQLAQSLSEHAVTYAGYAGKKLIESSRRWDQGLYDCPGPTLPYQLNGALKGRAVVEAPTDHGERFYAVSVVSETMGFFYFFDFLDRAARGSHPAVSCPQPRTS